MKHTEEVILKNSVQCLDCEKIIESKHRHMYVTCGCPNSAMVDGGHEYLRRGAMDGRRIKDLSEVEMRPVDCSIGYDGKCWRCESERRQEEWKNLYMNV